jgi:hypothetical protein
MEEALAAHTITRSALLRPYYFVLLAGAYLRVKEFSKAQRALDDARGGRHLDQPERLCG